MKVWRREGEEDILLDRSGIGDVERHSTDTKEALLHATKQRLVHRLFHVFLFLIY